MDEAKPALRRWLGTHTFPRWEGGPDRLLDAKAALGCSICVCLPALNEEKTIGDICASVGSLRAEGLIDEVLVVDSGSVDATVELAAAAGARVVQAASFASGFGSVEGKGDVLWRSLAVCEHDIIVWVDSDTRNFDTHFVTSLVAPLLANRDLDMVKAFYERPFVAPTGLVEGGARVTELTARPLINLLWPELSGFIQPLSGEYAIRREIALEIPFLTGYAVDLGLLVDVYTRVGLDRMAQSDLGMRVHRNQPLPALGRMASQVLQGALLKLEGSGRMKLSDDVETSLVQFVGHEPAITQVTISERPPMSSVLAR